MPTIHSLAPAGRTVGGTLAHWRWRISGPLLLLAMAGCASGPLKSEKLLLAREAVAHATAMGGNQYAPAEMQAARERLDYAETALNAGDFAHANALSEEAMVNAHLAESQLQAAKAEKAATELRQDQRTLQSEIQNNAK